VIFELRDQFKVVDLIRVAQIAKSTYYYWIKQLNKPDKYQKEKQAIQEIFEQNRGRYGYRRITIALRQRGFFLNHKTVSRLMKQLGIKCQVRPQKYRSYRGGMGKIAPNLLNRDFKAKKPHQKWVTDITEFSIKGEKLYLSPILDLYNGEIITYEIDVRPRYQLVSTMLNQAIKKLKEGETPILHSDQGWHYQMIDYQRTLEDHRLIQSMSRKGNCLDNAVIENFFGLLKSELFYLETFESINQFKEELVNYINYYNQERIKVKLKGMSPVQYRIHSSKIA
jgi:putative transposase